MDITVPDPPAIDLGPYLDESDTLCTVNGLVFEPVKGEWFVRYTRRGALRLVSAKTFAGHVSIAPPYDPDTCTMLMVHRTMPRFRRIKFWHG